MLHWDVKKLAPIVVVMVLVLVAAIGGCLSWSDMVDYLGIYW